MRIVSLLPAATEIVFALGLGDELVGVTHACDFPAEARTRPSLTQPVPELADNAVPASYQLACAAAHVGSAAAVVDEELLGDLRPDLVLTQERCPACATSYRQLGPAVRALLDDDATVLSLEPTSVEGILHAISTVGAMTSAEDEAVGLVEILRERLADVEETVAARRAAGHRAPRVVALEWLDPLVAPGHWVPEQVRRAGGWDLLGREGERPGPTSWDAVRDLDPEMLLVLPAAADLRGALAAWSRAPRPDRWEELRVARRGRVFALDGAAYFARPGPRVIDGIEMLAEIFDPDGFEDVAPMGGWRPVG